MNISTLTNSQAKYILNVYAQSVFGHNNIPFLFVTNQDCLNYPYGTPSCICGEGNTYSDIDEVKQVCIGLQELDSAKPTNIVDANIFTKVIVAIYHENAHVKQCLDNFQQTDDKSKSIALSHFASQGLSEYHNQTYFHQPNEIQAEYYGVLNGYKQLLKLTKDPELSNQLICKYTNDRYDNNVSFLSRNDYIDVKDIFSDFRELFKKECRKHKDFNAEECITNSDANKSLLKLIQNTQNGNVQNAIAVRQLLAHFEKQGRDSNNWDNYNRFTALPVIKALDLESSKLKNRIRSYFTLYPEGLDIKQVSIGDEKYERETIDLADNLYDNDSVKDV